MGRIAVLGVWGQGGRVVVERKGDVVPVVMRGVSLAPWLMPGDVLLLDRGVSVRDLRLGDVVVLKREGAEERIVHRIVREAPARLFFPFRTKGDRVGVEDPLDDELRFDGRVVARHRKGIWKSLKFRRLLWIMGKYDLYPGQRLPYWCSRSTVRKIFLGSRS